MNFVCLNDLKFIERNKRLLFLKYSFCLPLDSAARGGRATRLLLATLSGSPIVAACSKSTVGLSTAVLISNRFLVTEEARANTCSFKCITLCI
jgi:hypothetical protein